MAKKTDLQASQGERPQAAIEAEVLVYVGEQYVDKYSLTEGEYSIGRDKGCQICIETDGVSRHHARLTLRGYELIIEDLGSSNGVFIEGVQIRLATRLRPDQQVEIGSARLFIRLKPESSAHLEAALWDPDLGLAPVRTMLEGKRYKVFGTIGRGGMGVVHEARDLRIHRTVAMKAIKTASQFSRENVLRFVDEAQLTGQLQHPNIIPVYELGIDEIGEVFYTMKFVKGTTLDQVLRRIRDGDEAAVKLHRLAALLTVFQKVCDAVGYAHSMGVVHRDLKPDNVMIGEYGEVLLMDWGLAKKIARGVHDEDLGDVETPMPLPEQRGFETLNGLIVGTPPYISPESARGELDRIDPRSDIYVLGAILYAILTLRPPFPGKEFAQLIEQIASGQIQHPTSFSQPINPLRPSEPPPPGPDGDSWVLGHLPNRRIPDGLAAIVLKAMAVQPEDRYQTVAELQGDVLAWQGGFAPKAERAGLGRHIILWAGRHKGNVIAFSVFLIFLTVALVVFVVSIARERDRARASELATDGALKELRGAAPLFAEEARTLIQARDLDGALGRIESAIRQVPNEAAYHELRGNILETLLRWEEAQAAYEEALELKPDLVSARENLELTRRLIEETPEDHEPTTDQLKLLQQALLKQKRVVEASTLIERFGSDKPLAIKMLRQAVDNDPELRPLRDLVRGAQLRGRFQSRPDGSYSANFRGFPADAYLRILKSPIFPVTVVELDDPGFSDLSVFRRLKLESLSVAGCARITDLSPLQGMQLRVLNLSRTGVRDLSPLAGMPLVELNLEGCTSIADFSPLRECQAMEKLFLPRNAAGIGFLRDMPKLKYLSYRVSYKGLNQPVAEFWAEYDSRKAGDGAPAATRDGQSRPKVDVPPKPRRAE